MHYCICRLEAYDRNQNFGSLDDLGDDYSMDLPDISLYKDVNNETVFVDIKMGAIKSYLNQMDKTLDSDAENLHKERFLKYIRLAVSNNLFFVKSECRAQMRKSVTYILDISIDCDGTILESQCECAAGMGPNAHCKHVCCLLLALYNFTSSGEILTEETCTQRLQTFHHSKPFKGSPIKSANLSLAETKAQSVNFDPRPQKYRNTLGYSDLFRNTWLNHRDVNSMPIAQLYCPANVYAVASDHDYLKGSPEDRWLEANNVTKISDDVIKQIESNTIGQSKNPIWKSERCKRLQASNFGRICKATERTDFEKLAESLTMITNLKTPAILHGQKYEHVAILKYEEDFECSLKQCGIFVSKSYPFIGASPDAIVDNEKIVEVKCPYKVKDKVISPKTVPFLVEREGQLALNESHNYFYQIQGQLFCTNRNSCDLIVYTFKDVKYISVKRNDTFIGEMLEKLEKFYIEYFRKAVLDKFFYRDYKKYSFEYLV